MRSLTKHPTIVILSLLLYPILYTYGYGFLSFGFIFTALIFIYSIVKYRNLPLVFPKVLFIYVIYFMFMRLFIADELYYKIAFTTTSMFIFLGFYYYYLKDIELNFFLKIYRRITFINIIFFIFQEISYALLGYRFIGVLTSLPLTLGRGEIDVNSYVQTLTEHSRSSAFFSEPAHFAQFLLPILVLEIFCSNSRYKNWYSLIYIVTLLLLRSGNGFFGLIIIIVF